MNLPSTVFRMCLAVVMAALPALAAAKPLSTIQANGELSLCASENSLPYSSNKPDQPGFQIEIARALAERLGVRLRTEWIITRRRAATVDCDILMDTIVDPDALPRSIRLSRPYHVSGVALAFAPGKPIVAEYRLLPDGMRVGIMVNSLASQIVSRTGAAMVPFGFEDELIQAVASGSVTAGALSTASIGYHNLQHPDQQVQLVHAEDAEQQLRWSVAVGMRRADDPLVAAVDEAISALLDNGTISAIYRRYGVDHRRP